MRTLIHYACNAARLGQDIGWIETTIRLLFLLTALAGLVGLFIPSLHQQALQAFLLGALSYTALTTSHPSPPERGEVDEPAPTKKTARRFR